MIEDLWISLRFALLFFMIFILNNIKDQWFGILSFGHCDLPALGLTANRRITNIEP